MKERGVTGCSWSEWAPCHIYFGECEMRDACQRIVCLKTDKIRPKAIGSMLHLSLAINGVHGSGRSMDFHVFGTHSEEDINNTVKAFDISLGNLISEGILEPKGNHS
jgi:hypothetical protein